MDKTPKKSRKRYHGKSTSFQPRNESVTVMLSAHEKNEFEEKCFAHDQELSEKGRSLILAWLYDTEELTLSIKELSNARKDLNDFEKQSESLTNEILFQRDQITQLLELCRKNNISLPGKLNSNLGLTDTRGSKNDFEKMESDENDFLSPFFTL